MSLSSSVQRLNRIRDFRKSQQKLNLYQGRAQHSQNLVDKVIAYNKKFHLSDPRTKALFTPHGSIVSTQIFESNANGPTSSALYLIRRGTQVSMKSSLHSSIKASSSPNSEFLITRKNSKKIIKPVPIPVDQMNKSNSKVINRIRLNQINHNQTNLIVNENEESFLPLI